MDPDKLKELLEKEISEIQRIPLQRVSDLILQISRNTSQNTRIITSGMGKAGQIAHTFATTLSSIGMPSFFLHPSEAQHGDLGIVCPGDLVICFSNSGQTREVHELVDLVHKMGYGNLIYAIVGTSNFDLETKCAEVLEFGKSEEICPLGLTPTTSTTIMSIICDLIVVGIMKEKEFTKEQYSKTHHGGYLGKLSKQ